MFIKLAIKSAFLIDTEHTYSSKIVVYRVKIVRVQQMGNLSEDLGLHHKNEARGRNFWPTKTLCTILEC